MRLNLSAIRTTRPETIATAVLTIETPGEGFFEITGEVGRFLKESKARDGALTTFSPSHLRVARHPGER